MDWGRAARAGMPEAVYCASKTPDQIARIVAEATSRGAPLLLTRLTPEALSRTGCEGLDYDPLSGTAWLNGPTGPGTDCGVAIVTAGTSDAPAAREAERTLAFMGIHAPLIQDVGVAGLWRLTQAAESLQDRRVIIAVAGFEAALFSVLAGLVPAPVIAVPTSVGTGVAEGGRAALSSALASCAPGVVVVNIDNGFGAASAAIKMMRAFGHAPLAQGETP